MTTAYKILIERPEQVTNWKRRMRKYDYSINTDLEAIKML